MIIITFARNFSVVEKYYPFTEDFFSPVEKIFFPRRVEKK